MKKMARKVLRPANILLERHLRELGLEFEREYRFSISRRWRFDYILTETPDWLHPGPVAIEIEGGVYSQGRHVRGKGYEQDMAKYNHAMVAGWKVLRFSTGQILRGEAREFLAIWLDKG